MTDDQIIEAAMQGHASARDAIRWAMKQVRMQTNTHQQPSVSEINTHKPDVVMLKLLTEQEINDWFERANSHKESFQWTNKNWFQAGFAIAELVYGIGGSNDSRRGSNDSRK